MNQHRSSEIETFSSQIFHNILNPLTVISLQVESEQKKGPLLQNQVDTVIHHLTHLEYFVSLLCENVKQQVFHKKFSVNEEIEQALEIIAYAAKRKHVQILSLLLHEIQYEGNQLKFHQLLLEFFQLFLSKHEDDDEKNEKRIEITLEKKKLNFYLLFTIHQIEYNQETLSEIKKKFEHEFGVTCTIKENAEKIEFLYKFPLQKPVNSQ